jgi:gamma-glutamyltranspeptidase/glutathione hydrolase
VETLLSDSYGAERAALIRPDRRCTPRTGIRAAGLFPESDTVYFCCSDAEGNGCSFINSNFAGFGTGIVPEGCGYSLQNRGHGFVLEEGHPNCIAPGKRPYHTIIPALATREADGSLFALMGVMGGMMQPQGHLQVFLSLVEDGLDPQAALDRPRFQIHGSDESGAIPVPVEGREELLLEEGFGRPAAGSQAPSGKAAESGAAADGERGGGAANAESGRTSAAAESGAALRQALSRLGHPIRTVSGSGRSSFGLGQLILKTPEGMYWGASDPRGDGQAAARLP